MVRNRNTLLAACIGMSTGSALTHYTMSIFGAELVREFGWSRADFALVGTLQLASLPLIPLAGWFIDRYGVLVAAIVGFAVLTVGYVALAMMNGSLSVFFGLLLLKQAFGGLSSSLVFCRVAVEKFDLARGIALAAVMSASPLGGAIAAPLIGDLIATHGWRAGYLALAAISGIGGTIAIAMLWKSGRENAATRITSRTELAAPMTTTGRSLRGYVKEPVLILLMAGMFLVNVPQVFASSQLKLITMSAGASDAFSTWLVSVYALGVIVGRLATGVALDRIAPHLIALAALGLPCAGFLILADGTASEAFLLTAVLLIGLAQGAEGDIGAFLLSRNFGTTHFSLLFGVMTSMLAAGSASGSLILSATLRSTESYTPFLLVSAIATLAGAACFTVTGLRRLARPQGERRAPG